MPARSSAVPMPTYGSSGTLNPTTSPHGLNAFSEVDGCRSAVPAEDVEVPDRMQREGHAHHEGGADHAPDAADQRPRRAPANGLEHRDHQDGEQDQPELRLHQECNDAERAGRRPSPSRERDQRGQVRQRAGRVDLAPHRACQDRRRVQQVETGDQQPGVVAGATAHHREQHDADRQVEGDRHRLDRELQRRRRRGGRPSATAGRAAPGRSSSSRRRTRHGPTSAMYSAQAR